MATLSIGIASSAPAATTFRSTKTKGTHFKLNISCVQWVKNLNFLLLLLWLRFDKQLKLWIEINFSFSLFFKSKEGPRRCFRKAADRTLGSSWIQKAARERRGGSRSIWATFSWREGTSPSSSPSILVLLFLFLQFIQLVLFGMF